MAYVFLPTVVANIFFLTGTAYNILPLVFLIRVNSIYFLSVKVAMSPVLLASSFF